MRTEAEIRAKRRAYQKACDALVKKNKGHGGFWTMLQKSCYEDIFAWLLSDKKPRKKSKAAREKTRKVPGV